MKRITHRRLSAVLVLPLLWSSLIVCVFALRAQSGPRAKTREEYDAYTRFVSARDDQERIAEGKRFFESFKESDFRPVVYREVVFAMTRAGRHEEAFAVAEAGLKENPANLTLLLHMAYDASDQVLRNNKAFVAQGKEVGSRALEALRTGARPAEYSEETWAQQKGMRMGILYRSMGVIESESHDKTKALEHLRACVASDKTDALGYYLLGRQLVPVYDALRNQALNEKRPAVKKDLVDQVTKLQEEVLNTYARSYVLSSSRPDLAVLHQAVEPEFKRIYSITHSGSLAGIEAYIDAAKGAVTP